MNNVSGYTPIAGNVTYLLVELDISGLKLLLDVRGTHVVRELVV